MTVTIDFRVAELLCSRLCHDLISPVMAINNGMELIADDTGPISDDIKELLTMSAGSAATKLQFYRIAYGLGGQDAAPVGMPEARRLTRGLIEEGKIELDWPEESAASTIELTREATKLLLNMMLLGIESLPRGGELRVRLEGGSPALLAVGSIGTGAKLRAESAAAMAADADTGALSARSVQGYLVGFLARALGCAVDVDADADALTLKATVPG